MDPALAIEVAAMSQQKALNDVTARGDSEVQKFYNNSVVFVTGGSGFLGKQLIEKLMRSCRISKVFMLLRPKKGKYILERLEDIFNDPVFVTLREQQPDFRAKIVAVEGDAAELKLGISNANWKILTEEVDVIFHVAATTKFDETLHLATLINVRGTREALVLAKSCKRLRSYVHVSTAYLHAIPQNIGKEFTERFYEPPIAPETMISMAESINAETLKAFTDEITKDWPNTYTFTKSLSEDLVLTESVGIPICIVRPGIVICCYREPSAGWLDFSCVYGASGQLLGACLGVIHTTYANPDAKIGFVPCDYVNNAIIVAGSVSGTNQAKGGMDTKIYTVTSTERNPITCKQVKDTIESTCRRIQTPKILYYGFFYQTASYWLFVTLLLILHVVPAYMADFVCLLLGKKRIFAKTVKKAYKMSIAMSFVTLNNWKFRDDNLDKLYKNLSKRDRHIFNFDVTNINWTEYIQIWWIGIRKYIIKDGLKDTEYAVKKLRYLRMLHYLLVTLYSYGVWKVLYFVLK